MQVVSCWFRIISQKRNTSWTTTNQGEKKKKKKKLWVRIWEVWSTEHVSPKGDSHQNHYWLTNHWLVNGRSKIRIKRAKRGDRLCPTLTQNIHQWVTEKSEQCILKYNVPQDISLSTFSSNDLHGHRQCSALHRAREWRRHVKELWLRCRNLI